MNYGTENMNTEKIRAVANSISRATGMTQTIEFANLVVKETVRLCKEKDADGTPYNIDTRRNAIVIAVPWGKKGFAKWGITSTTCQALGRIIGARRGQECPFVFDDSARRWCFNEEVAWRDITVSEWRNAYGVQAQTEDPKGSAE